ncbi:Nitrogen assimilation transcription factor nirA [Beauveria bassiana]|nr:Nitrogen assimilation transcription factor nirA [Beauveria bassiana]
MGPSPEPLEEENNQLRASLQARVSATLTIQSPPATSPSDREPSRLESRGQSRGNPSTEKEYAVNEMQSLPCGQPNMSVDATMPTRSQDQQSRYFHGPSSVMFDSDNNRRTSLKHNGHQPLLDERLGAQLVANHTKQRHLEMINANSGKLDLDGVDVDLAMDLLSIFWNRQHYEGSAIYRPVFMRDMAANGPYFSKLLLYAILFAASKYAVDDRVRSDPHDPETTGIPFRRRFEEVLVEPGANRLFESELTTAQALLIVANVLLSWRDESSLAWHYTGVAINMIIDLGIHTERHPTQPTSIYKAEKVELHRRVFWAAFILDKIHAIYQGRPARLSGTNISVPILFHDDYDEYEPFQTITFTATPRQLRRPTHSLSTMVELCKLSQIMDKILRELYAEQSQSRTASDILNTSMILHHELKRWRGELPPHLNVRRRGLETAVILPHTLAMVSMYDSLVILLHRPFVSEGHLQSASSFIAREALSHCVIAAFEVHDMLQLYKQHFCVKTVPYFMSYATYVSATIHARLASLKSMGSLPGQCLKNCLNVLAEQQTKCLAPRRTLKILKQLIRRLGLRMEDLPTEEFEVSRGNEPDSDGHILTPAMSSLPEVTYLSRVSEQPPAGVVAEDRMHDGNMTDFDSMFLDMDMDGILKSFGVISNEAVPVHPGGNRFDGGMVLESMGNVESTALEQEYETGPGSSGVPVFSDPLFGFDFDIV